MANDRIEHISAVWADVARHHDHTLKMLRLLQLGHPGSDEYRAGRDEFGDADPTGALGITHDQARADRERYLKAIRIIEQQVTIAEDIRLRMMPPTDAELARVPDPDDWCDNCIRAQVLSPRKKANRSRHCKWCITVRQTYGSLPSIEAIKMHHESGSSRALHRLLSGRPVGRRTA